MTQRLIVVSRDKNPYAIPKSNTEEVYRVRHSETDDEHDIIVFVQETVENWGPDVIRIEGYTTIDEHHRIVIGYYLIGEIGDDLGRLEISSA